MRSFGRSLRRAAQLKRYLDMNIINVIDFNEDISDAIEAFSEETDRGTVLISASLIEDTLEEIIRKKLIVSENKNDELFDSPYTPLKTLSAKIDFSYRIGLINKKTHSVFHQVREMRNEFAHGFLPVSFEDQKVFDKVSNILSHYYEYIIDIFSRTIVDDKLLADIKNFSGNKKNAKKIIELVGPRSVYERICAFVYAYLKDKEHNVIRLNLDSEDSIL